MMKRGSDKRIMPLNSNKDTMAAFDPTRIDDHETFLYERDSSGDVHRAPTTPLDAFDEMHGPVYDFLESYNSRDTSVSYSGGMYGSGIKTPEEITPAEEEALERWKDNTRGVEGEKFVKTEITDIDGNTYVFDWLFRKETSPSSVGTPFSMVPMRSEEGYNMGFRVCRLYDSDVAKECPIKGRNSFNPELTAKMRWSEREMDDEYGWIQEPFLRAALDSEEGVHDQLADLEAPRLTERSQAYVDQNESPDYHDSEFEVGLFYEWAEPILNNGIQEVEAVKLGHHAAVLNSLGLMTYPDRKPEEFFIEVGPEKYEVQQKDLEFAMYTDNMRRINHLDVNDLTHQLDRAIRDTASEDSVYEARRELPEVMKDARIEKMREIDQKVGDEEIIQLIPENVPMQWDPDLFPEEMDKVEW